MSTPTPTTEPHLRFDGRTRRGRGEVAALPPELERLVPDEFARYRRLVERHAAARRKVAELDAELERVQALDEAEAARAFADDLPLPKAKAGKVEQALDEARRELELAQAAMPAASQALFTAAAPFVEQALAEADRLVEAELEAIPVAIADLRERVAAAGAADAQHGWLVGATNGHAPSFAGGRSRTFRELEDSLRIVERELAAGRDRRAEFAQMRVDELAWREQTAADKAQAERDDATRRAAAEREAAEDS